MQDKTTPKQWEYVETKSNPADEGSPCIDPRSILDSKWISGPDFLWKSEDQWAGTLKKVFALNHANKTPKSRRSLLWQQ